MKNPFITRLTSFGLITILLALMTFSIWAALTTQQVANRVAASEYLNDQYLQACFAVGTEEALERKYRLEPSPETLAAYKAADTALVTALNTIAQNGDTNASIHVQLILASHQLYLDATYLMFVAVDKGNTSLARNIDHLQVDPIFTNMQQQVNTEAISYRSKAAQSLAELAATEQTVFLSTLIVFPLGFLLFISLLLVIRVYRQKIEEGIHTEMARLARTAFIDNVTGLGNHRAYQEDLHRLLLSASEVGKNLVLVIVDIDGLKMINDASGHLEGDRVLTTFAQILQLKRDLTYIYRLSGDEFAIILPGLTLYEAANTMELLRQNAEHGLFGATVSIGLAHCLFNGNESEILQEQAYLAVSEAKRRSHNTCVTFESIRENVSFVPPEKVHALHRLLNERRMDVAFQPIWDIGQDRILSFEALSRPPMDYGFNGPQELFDIAEKVGRAHELDSLCVHSILARAAELPSDALLFLNLTPQTLDHNLLTGTMLRDAVFAAGLTPDRVVLEITERSVVQLDSVVREARKLRALGFRLALDDTGAGNAGLEMLSQLPVDFVKIDRAIVVKSLTDTTALTIFRGITTMARQMNSYVIAEGIEDVEMLNLVQMVGAQGVQGYLLGRPNQKFPTAQALQALRPSAQRTSLDLLVAAF